MHMPRRTPRVDEVAKITRLSPRTVAGILNGDGGTTSRAVRERVRLVAERLGHQAPPGTRLLLVQSRTPYFSFLPQPLFQGLVDGARTAGCRMELAVMPDERLDNEAGLLALLHETGANGLLINYQHNYPRALPDLVERLGIPTMWINSLHRHDCVMPGDFDGAVTLTRHLLALGHRRIAYADLTNDFTGHSLHHSCLERLDGYKQAMVEAGCGPLLIGVEQPLDAAGRDRAIHELLATPERPSAVIAYCPRSLMPFYHEALGRLRLAIPADLSLACFVNEEYEIPGLDITRLMVPWLDLGRAAIIRLVARCAQPAKRFDPLMLPLPLMPGTTTGPWRVTTRIPRV
jgi:LacI family transcriptional regulator